MPRFATGQMLKRLTITSLLGLALLFSQGGVLLIAALCPHLRLAVPVCGTMTGDGAMDHSQMTHYEMDQDSSLLATVAEDRIAFGPGDERPCSHCAIHVRANSNTAWVRTAEVGKRSAELKVSQTVSVLPPGFNAGVAVLTPREHGPPGDASRPKHVLLNTFRI